MKNKQKKFSRELIIGTFSAAVLIFGYLGFNWLKNKQIFSNDYVLTAYYDRADGIEAAAPVMARGFKIGNVESVSLDLQKQEVKVTMIILGDYALYDNARAAIISTSLLGGKAIEITMHGEGREKLVNGDTISGHKVEGLMDMVESTMPGVIAELGDMTTKINSILTSMDNTLDESTIESIQSTVSNLSSLSSQLNNGDITSAIKDIKKLTASLSAMAPDMERGVDNIVALTDDLKKSAPELVNNLQNSLTSLSTILEGVENGEGSVGKLLKDDALYDNVNSTLENLEALLEDLKANPSKYINVKVF